MLPIGDNLLVKELKRLIVGVQLGAEDHLLRRRREKEVDVVVLEEPDGAVDATEHGLVQHELNVDVAVSPVAVEALLLESPVLN